MLSAPGHSRCGGAQFSDPRGSADDDTPCRAIRAPEVFVENPLRRAPHPIRAEGRSTLDPSDSNESTMSEVPQGLRSDGIQQQWHAVACVRDIVVGNAL
jgi:hypothetical protein